MKDRTTTRTRNAKCQRPRCVICGGTDKIEFHHVGGRHHVVWFIVPLCQKHHARLTAALRIAGVDMRFTRDVRERFARARMATQVFLWILEEMLKQHEQKEKQR